MYGNWKMLSEECHSQQWLRPVLPELNGFFPNYVNQCKAITLKDAETQHILWALRKTGWKIKGVGGAAELLNLPATTLSSKMKKLKIVSPDKKAS